jgi:hypothetical protein
MADDLVTIRTFWNVGEAHLATNLLEAAGIQAFLENEYSVMMMPHMANPSGIQLKTRRSQSEKAIETLKGHD